MAIFMVISFFAKRHKGQGCEENGKGICWTQRTDCVQKTDGTNSMNRRNPRRTEKALRYLRFLPFFSPIPYALAPYAATPVNSKLGPASGSTFSVRRVTGLGMPSWINQFGDRSRAWLRGGWLELE